MQPHISIDPDQPQTGRPATASVSGSNCNPFTIRVLFLDVDPPDEVEAGSGYNNPPPADLPFDPPAPGNYRVEVVCAGVVTGSKDFTVS